MDQVLLRPLPVHDPAQLVLLDGPGAFMGRTFNNMTFSYPMYSDFRDRNKVFAGVLARFPLALTAVWRGASERANGELVTGNYFDVLGVRRRSDACSTPPTIARPAPIPSRSSATASGSGASAAILAFSTRRSPSTATR